MNSDSIKVIRSEELFDEYLELKEGKEKLAEERQALDKEREEIQRVKCSVEYLKQLHEKSKLEESQQEIFSENEASLKVHLYASKFESHQLKDQLETLNTILSLSPYVFLLIDLKEMSINWASKNVKNVLGFTRSQLKGKKMKELFVRPEHDLLVKDGFVMAQPIIKADQSKIWVDLSFQLKVSDEIEGALITCHQVSERFKAFEI